MGGDSGGCCSGQKVCKAFGGLMLMIFVGLLLIGVFESWEDAQVYSHPSPGNYRHAKLVRKIKHSFHGNHDDDHHHLIYVSKRRVPNGPDPIHNRHIGENRRPSGRV